MAEQLSITLLPSEILCKIFEDLADLKAPPYSFVWPLALTCKRFYGMAQPLIWSHVTLRSDDTNEEPLWSKPGASARSRSRKLRRSLNLFPKLKTHAKRVSLLGREEIGFIDAISVIQSFPHIRRLDLESVANMGRTWDDTPYRAQRNVREKDEVALPSQDQEGSALFDELHITRFNHGSPQALRNFLKWPAALKVFTVDELAMGDYDWHSLLEMNCNNYKWTYQLLVEVISGHKTTLKELRIGQIGPENLDGFSINHFTALQLLQINCCGRPTPEAACDSWAIANLKKLVMECSLNDSQHGVLPNFSIELSRWLKKFATLAVARKQNGSSALVEIEILYYLNDDEPEIDIETRRLLEDTECHIKELGLLATITYTYRYLELE